MGRIHALLPSIWVLIWKGTSFKKIIKFFGFSCINRQAGFRVASMAKGNLYALGPHLEASGTENYKEHLFFKIARHKEAV